MSTKLRNSVVVIVCPEPRPILMPWCAWNGDGALMRDGRRIEFVRESSAAAFLSVQPTLVAAGAYVKIVEG